MGYIKYVVKMMDGKRYAIWATSKVDAGKMGICKSKLNGGNTKVDWVKRYNEVYRTVYPLRFGGEILQRL